MVTASSCFRLSYLVVKPGTYKLGSIPSRFGSAFSSPPPNYNCITGPKPLCVMSHPAAENPSDFSQSKQEGSPTIKRLGKIQMRNVKALKNTLCGRKKLVGTDIHHVG